MPKIQDDPQHDVRAGAADRERPQDETFMRLALEQAEMGRKTPGGGEVGCVIVKDGKPLASGFNQTEMDFDPTGHAEIVTLRRLGKLLGATEFRGCTVYCTLQCCSMCAAACIWAKVGRIVYGATRNDVHELYFDARHYNTADLIQDAFRDDIELIGGVLAEECARLYRGPDEAVSEAEQTNK